MARLRLEDIRKEAGNNGWKVVSESYKNLNEEMSFLCPEEHNVYTSWKKLRDSWDCPVCSANIYKNLDTRIISKRKGAKRVLAIDQATITSGWSVFDDGKLVKYGIFSVDSSIAEIKRISSIKNWLISMVKNWEPDIVAIEDIQLQKFNKESTYSSVGVTTFKVLAHLQGVLMETLNSLGIRCEICHQSTWRTYCGVKGKSRADMKRSMQLIAKKEFDITVTNDIADAIGIGKYASEKIGRKQEVFNWE